ncbi:hypothetical protein ACFW6Q_19585 [Streptomyces sp. NPDC058737]|uniref:hypothetical protein n=1 Tax=Streptomyces TaxID=1883 RepID=UPI002109A0BE|nr:hypothetical protein [Streptomyces coelicoflavus]MCQ4202200.1 hypothetical protein [Streptomyces coelicoflavus]
MLRYWKRRRSNTEGQDGGRARGQSGELRAFGLSQREIQAVARLIGHTHHLLAQRSGSDDDTLRNASGAELLSLLYPRIGLVIARGGSGAAMRVAEIRHVEAAILNLESYGGHETVLCEGYALLARLEELAGEACEAQLVDGVLALPGQAPRISCS